MDVGTKVWVKSDEYIWASGVVLEVSIYGFVQIRLDANGETHRYNSDHREIFIRNDNHDFIKMPCLTGLEYLHEPALLHALSERFAHDHIYTWIGDILIALNPFKDLSLYTDAEIDEYKVKMLECISKRHAMDCTCCLPHVFSVAAKAFSGLLQSDAKNQSILVSGESGAGKTESTKFLMKFLTAVGHEFALQVSDPDHSTDIIAIGQRILQTNPILEAFGNACTIRNDNSSRFGKFIKIQFGTQNHIIGAEIVSYLLEKVRLVHQTRQEGNFHIFYELLEGGDTTLLSTLELEKDVQYEILNTYEPSKRINRIEYRNRFQQTVQAFEEIGIDQEERYQIFRILAALLHLGNVNFQSYGDEMAMVTEKSRIHLEKCATLLGVHFETLELLLLAREITAGMDRLKLRLNASQAKDASRSIAKSVYGRLFTWLVGRLSDGINYVDYVEENDDEGIKTIGILDIFGFESLQENGFEQICINYANERLQAQFNEFVFIKEQSVYAVEEIDWESISYPSNLACLAIFDEKPNGLFSLLDQECILPKGSNLGLCTKYYRFHANNDTLQASMFPAVVQSFSGRYLNEMPRKTPFSASKMDRVQQRFVIHHFAGNVCYRVVQFIEKNQDPLPTDAYKLLTTSNNPIIVSISFHVENIDVDCNTHVSEYRVGSRRGSLLRTPSVSAQFRGQLDALIDEIGQTQAHYIRCLKPNEDKIPELFDRHRMVDQLRSVGILEALRVARESYPVRLLHSTFLDTFSCYRSNLENNMKYTRSMTTRDLCKLYLVLLLEKLYNCGSQGGKHIPQTFIQTTDERKFNSAIHHYGVQLGKTIVFFKTETYTDMIALRHNLREWAVQKLHRVISTFLRRQRFLRTRRAVLCIQSVIRGHQARRFVSRLRLVRMRIAMIRIQRVWKRALGRKRQMDEKIRIHRLYLYFSAFRRGIIELKLSVVSPRQSGCKRRSNKTVLRAYRSCPSDSAASNRVLDDDEVVECNFTMSSRNELEGCRAPNNLELSTDDDTYLLRKQIDHLHQQLRKERNKKSRNMVRVKKTSTKFENRPPSKQRTRKKHLDNEMEMLSLRRLGSVSHVDQGCTDHTHVVELTKRMEMLDDKCRLLEQLIIQQPSSRSEIDDGTTDEHVVTLSGLNPQNRGYPESISESSSNKGESEGKPVHDNGAHRNSISSSVRCSGELPTTVESMLHSLRHQIEILHATIVSKEDEYSSRVDTQDETISSFAQTRSISSSTFSGIGYSNGLEDSVTIPHPVSPAQSEMQPRDEPNLLQNHHRSINVPRVVSDMSCSCSGPPGVNFSSSISIGYSRHIAKWTRGTQCSECQEPFTLFTRRHHCRLCGRSFCFEHSSRRVSILGIGFDEEPVRVCDACFVEHRAQMNAELSMLYNQCCPTPTSFNRHYHHPMFQTQAPPPLTPHTPSYWSLAPNYSEPLPHHHYFSHPTATHPPQQVHHQHHPDLHMQQHCQNQQFGCHLQFQQANGRLSTPATHPHPYNDAHSAIPPTPSHVSATRGFHTSVA